MFIPDPNFYSSWIPDPGSRIPDPKTVTKERGEKNFHTFFYSHKLHKIVIYFIFGSLKKKIWVNFQRIIELFTPKIVKNIGLGSRIQGSKGHWNPDPDSQHCIPAKINQHEATRAVMVCGLRRTMKEIMSYGNISKSTVYDVERKFEKFIASGGSAEAILTGRKGTDLAANLDELTPTLFNDTRHKIIKSQVNKLAFFSCCPLPHLFS
jgi:hypothetical protein